jgi:hypothetical protein
MRNQKRIDMCPALRGERIREFETSHEKDRPSIDPKITPKKES